MNQREAFLQAITDDPRDYVTRQAFADWLDEHDEPELADFHRRFTVESHDEAKRWLEEFARRHFNGYSDDAPAITYEEVVKAGRDYVELGIRFTQFGSQSLQDELRAHEMQEQFWRSWELVTGIPMNHLEVSRQPFSCAC